MKLALMFFAALLAYVQAQEPGCHLGIWGCGASIKLSSSHHDHSSHHKLLHKAHGHVRRDAADDCLFGRWGCHSEEKQRELAKAERERRQIDCPFGLWGCRRRRGVRQARAVKNDNLNDLIEDMFRQQRKYN